MTYAKPDYLKGRVLSVRDQVDVRIAKLPGSKDKLGVLDQQYFTEEFWAATKAVVAAFDEAIRLFNIAYAKQERDCAQHTVDQRTADIAELEGHQ